MTSFKDEDKEEDHTQRENFLDHNQTRGISLHFFHNKFFFMKKNVFLDFDSRNHVFYNGFFLLSVREKKFIFVLICISNRM
jgi:hypothetical protein